MTTMTQTSSFVRFLLFGLGLCTLLHAPPSLRAEPSTALCSADPELNAMALLVMVHGDAIAFRMSIASDPAFAARFGSPSVSPAPYATSGLVFGYPPLQDPLPELERVRAQPEIASAYPNGRACLAAPPPDALANVVEFHHAELDQYFYSADAGEIAAVDAGRVGAGWVRTGQTFRVDIQPGCPFTSDTPVYRFAAAPGGATGAHVFTRDRAECHVVNASRQWDFEGVPFWASVAGSDGRCPVDRVPLTRIWRPFGASTHRYTTNPEVANAMTVLGWIVEGTTMCVRPAGS